MLELLENLEANGPLTACLQKGVKVYHMAYASTAIRTDAEAFAAHGAKIIQPVRDAEFFAHVCFLMLRNQQMIELVSLRPTDTEAPGHASETFYTPPFTP